MGTHDGRIAVVTGAARGIGQAICRMLAERGATVVGADVADLSETAALVTDSGAGFLGVTCDMSSTADIAALAAKTDQAFGRCDILINNAAIFPTAPFADVAFDVWRQVMAINLDAPFLLCRAIVPMMKRNGWGRIVNIVSSSVENSRPGMTAYKASKAGLVGFTRGLAPDVAADGICVNAVSPAFTRTPGNMSRSPEMTRRLAEMADTQCIKRIAEPDDVVPAILFLSSDDAGFVTGQTIYADGGMYFR